MIKFANLWVLILLYFIYGSLSGRNKELVESYNPEEDNPYLVIYYLKY